MPSTVNGIGSWYYGKKNVCQHSAICESCQKEGVMRSYDTTLFFVFFFVPLFPLKKVRVLYECPYCRRHRFLPMQDWLEGKKKDLDKARDDLRELAEQDEVEDAEVKKIIGTFVSYEDADELQTILPTIKNKFGQNPEIMTNLACAYAAFNRYAEAERILTDSLRIKESNDTREILADILIKRGKPDKAAEYLSHIVADEIPDRIGCLVQLAEAYQAMGEHDKALKVLDDCVLIVPALEHEKWLKEHKKTSEKNLKSGKKINNGVIPTFSEKSGTDLPGVIAKLTGPVILCAILALYLFFCFSLGQDRTVHLINGINRKYSVEFNGNGEEIKLSPFSHREISIPEGKYTIEVKGINVPEIKGEFSTNFFLRPFVFPVVVFNPDGGAVMIRLKTSYSTVPRLRKPPTYKYISGQRFYVLDSVDYLFQDFPKEIKMKEGTVRAKTRLGIESPKFFNDKYLYLWMDLGKKSGKEQAVQTAKNTLQAVPDSEVALSYLYTFLGPNQFIDAVKPSLDVKPALVPNHRDYQEAMIKINRCDELIKEYKDRLNNNPDDSSYLYLLGRISSNRDEAIKLYKQGADASNPCPYSLHGLAYDAFIAGDFRKACDLWAKAVARDPGNTLFIDYYKLALLADRKYDDLLKIIRKELQENPVDLPSIFTEMQVCFLKNNAQAAQKYVDDKLALLIKKYPNSKFERFKLWFYGQLAYLKGDTKAYCDDMRSITTPEARLITAITENNYLNAENAYNSCTKPTLRNALLMCLMSRDAKKTEQEKKYLQDTVALLQKGKRDTQLMADYLSGKCKPEFNRIRYAGMDHDSKCALLILLADKYPEISRQCLELAGRMNFGHFFPYLYVRKHLSRLKK